MLTVLQAIILYSFCFVSTDGSHYRGGSITWRPQYPQIEGQNPVPIFLQQRHVWNTALRNCNATNITGEAAIGDSSVVKCISPQCHTESTLASTNGPCRAYSVKNSWSAMIKSTLINISSNVSFEAAFQGGNWIGTLGHGRNGRWSVSTKISTISRSDGTYNTAPSASMSSIKLLRNGTTSTWTIPVADTDGDIVRCRWATWGPPDECGAVCGQPPHAFLDNQSCTINYTANTLTPWAIALKIEDFEASSPTIALSGTSLQFIVQAYIDKSTCEKRQDIIIYAVPSYVGEKPDGSCVTLTVGKRMNEVAQFITECENETIVEVEMHKPSGMQESAVSRHPFNSSLYTMNITWAPTRLDLGTHLVCYTPLDNTNRQGHQACIKYFVSDDRTNQTSNHFIVGSMRPVGQVDANASMWSIRYTRYVTRPSTSNVFIRFYSKSTGQVVHEINVRTNQTDVQYSQDTLSFRTPMIWTEGEEYYILLDRSVVTDPGVCGSQSPEINDPTFWTFQVSTEDTNDATLPSTTNDEYSNSVPVEVCVAPTITLLMSSSSLQSPTVFRRDEDFWIDSVIELNCTRASFTTIQWTITGCASNCSFPTTLDSAVITTANLLDIPARTLSPGVYELKLTVTMDSSPNLTSSAMTYVAIVPSGIRPNLIELGTLMISRGHQQSLLLNPGLHSRDSDGQSIHPRHWEYEYECRIEGVSNFENMSCIASRSDNATAWYFTGESDVPASALMITAGSLRANWTYQFRVHMTSRVDRSLQGVGYLLVSIDETYPPLITIGCTVPSLCVPHREYQHVNSTSSIALNSFCTEYCRPITSIQWILYQGLNSSNGLVTWRALNHSTRPTNTSLFGMRTSNLTVMEQLWLDYRFVELWRFEVIYSFENQASKSALQFQVNHPPKNASCSLYPMNEINQTRFTISCQDWFDDEGFADDYSVYAWTTDPTDRWMLVWTSAVQFQLRLPAGDRTTFALHILIRIRCPGQSTMEWNFAPTYVTPVPSLTDLLRDAQGSSNDTNILLIGDDRNMATQILTILAQEMSYQNMEMLSTISSDNESITDESLFEQSAIPRYDALLTTHGKINNDLITIMTKLPILNRHSLQLQASALAHLTRTSNAMTAMALREASDRCLQLTAALHSMAGQVPYDDLLETASYLAQSISNIMTAINGPLQGRIRILALDWAQANDFPLDYNTDLELEWSNLHLFADGDDFSPNTIEKNRYRYYRQQLATRIHEQRNGVFSLLSLALNSHVTENQSIVIASRSVHMIMEKVSNASILNKSFTLFDDTIVRILFNLTEYTNVTLRIIWQPMAPVGLNRLSTNTQFSRLVSVAILNQDGYKLPFETNNEHAVELIIPHSHQRSLPPMIVENITEFNNLTDARQPFLLRTIEVKQTLASSVHFQIRPPNQNLTYLFIYKFDQPPVWTKRQQSIDGWRLLCPSGQHTYEFFIDPQQTIGHAYLIFGLRELTLSERATYCFNRSLSTPPVINEPSKFTADYQIRVFISGCYYLDTQNYWRVRGLHVGPKTNEQYTQCYSSHLTPFAGGFRVVPKWIEFNYVFSNADFHKNKTIYLTVIIVCILYLLLMIYARHRDRKDIEQLGVTPLPDNQKTDQYFYHLLILTGHRHEAGTRSKVHFVLSGDDDQTPVRWVTDPKRRVLQRGGIDAFVMACPRSLGPLNFLHIWHDNTGEGADASWFLKSFVVHDLQTMQRFDFICQRWLAVERDDGLIERVLPVAGPLEMNAVSHVLSKQIQYNVSDGHLWFSIFFRPVSYVFTRVQRCTCCFVLFAISMCLSIIYYDVSSAAKAKENSDNIGISLGPIYISVQQIVISIIVEALSLIPSLIVVQLFRRLRPRRQKTASLREVIAERMQRLTRRRIKTYRRSRTLPWWWIFIAYGLSFLLIAFSILLTIARGIEFGDWKSQQWLISIVISFVSSLFLLQPLKVLMLTIFYTCLKSTHDDPNRDITEHLHNTNFDLSIDEEYLHCLQASGESPLSSNAIRCLTRVNVVRARQIRLQEIQMWSIIREGVMSVAFLLVLGLLIYSTRDHHNSHLQVDHLRKLFLNHRNHELDYTKIATIDEYWSWLENSFSKSIRSPSWYNGRAPRDLRGFIRDRVNQLVGKIILRQFRVSSRSCPSEQIRSICYDDYSRAQEEKRSFQPGWINATKSSYLSSIRQAFKYQSNRETNTNNFDGQHGTYSNGGYVYSYSGNLTDLSILHRLGWIDQQTRAIVIQLNLYNPNTQLYTAVTLASEFLSTGSLVSQGRLDPFHLQVFTSIFHWIGLGFFGLLMIYLMVVELQRLFERRWSYFRQFWSYIELGLIICAWLAAIIYLYLSRESNSLHRFFLEKIHLKFVNLQRMVLLDDLFTCLLGFMAFLATLRFLRLCHLHPRLVLFVATLQHVRRPLLRFSMMFSIVFIAFVCLFYGLFAARMERCSSIWKTVQMIFEMALLNADGKEFGDIAPTLGPLVFTLFILLAVFVCRNMFVSIVMDSSRNVRKTNNEVDPMFTFMYHRFRRWIGNGDERDSLSDYPLLTEPIHYVTWFESYPEQMERLVRAVDRLHNDQCH